MSALDFPCPRCAAAAGSNCFYGRGQQAKGTHSARLELARHEERGPSKDDTVFMLGGLKLRALGTYSGEVHLRYRNAHTVHKRPRASFAYDATAGMWRELEAAS